MTLKLKALFPLVLVCAGLNAVPAYAQQDDTQPIDTATPTEATGAAATPTEAAGAAAPADPCPLMPLVFKNEHQTLAEQKTEEKELKKLQSLQQLKCLKSLPQISDEVTTRITAVEETHVKANPIPEKQETNTSDDNFVGAFELGLMQRPDYEDGNNSGFSQTDQYFDAMIDGRFEFSELWGKSNILINTTFLTSFYGEGIQDTEEQGGPAFPTSFNEVSDSMDASFSLRFSAIEAKGDCVLSCIFANEDKTSSLGVMFRYGLVNRDEQAADFDTTINYYGVSLDYRLYRNDMKKVGNAIPDFNVTWLVTRYEEYGVQETTEGCFVGGNAAGCLAPIDGPTRHIFQLRNRLLEDQPYFIGMRLNAGDGLDDYGITLGIRKNASDLFKFLSLSE